MHVKFEIFQFILHQPSVKRLKMTLWTEDGSNYKKKTK